MELPKIQAPVFTVSLPLSKKTVKYRPFLVKEERILLTAIEGFDETNVQDSNTLLDAIFQILQNCVLTPDVDVKKLPALDVEYLFLNIRKKSVGENIQIMIKTDPKECGLENKQECVGVNRIDINLDDVEMIIPENKKNIQLTDNIGIIMKYPDLQRALNSISKKTNSVEMLFDLVVASIDKIYNGDDHSSADKYKEEDLKEWVMSFSPKQMENVYVFFKNLPYLKLDAKYKCSKCNKELTKEVKGTASFFI